jgi:hypothetical protein
MDFYGHQSAAECAGLDPAAIHSIIRVNYPDAGRSFMGDVEVTVFLFFDAEGRLIRHWTGEFYWGL